MTSQVVSVLCGGKRLDIPNIHTLDNSDNKLTPCEAYQSLFERYHSVDVLVYVHDDVTIHDEDWQFKLEGIFVKGLAVGQRYTDSPVVAAGLGGATCLGRPWLYKVPYAISNMARAGYASNQTDAEVHGQRFTGKRRVAVLDAFLMAVRPDFLKKVGGWPVNHLSHHCLDLWVACEAARYGKEIWTSGSSIMHHGGGTSTKQIYRQAKWLKGGTLETDHQEPHRWLYENYRDVLPIIIR